MLPAVLARLQCRPIPALYRALYQALVRVLRLAIAPANTTEELLNGFLWKISYRRW
jgi:hypothetical protein